MKQLPFKLHNNLGPNVIVKAFYEYYFNDVVNNIWYETYAQLRKEDKLICKLKLEGESFVYIMQND